MADQHTQHIGLIRQITSPCAVSDRLYSHRREWSELLRQCSGNAGAGRGGQFFLYFRVPQRNVFEHLHRGWGRYGVQAVITADVTASGGDRSAADGVNLQVFQGESDADDIDNGIECSYFMEVNGIDRDVVDFCLCFADGPKDSQSPLHDTRGITGMLNEVDDLAVPPVCMMMMFVVVVMHVMMVVVTVVMPMLMLMLMMMFVAVVFFVNDVHFQSCYTFFYHSSPFQTETAQRQLPELLLDVFPICAGVHKSRQRHVSAYARKTIQICYFHQQSSFPLV